MLPSPVHIFYLPRIFVIEDGVFLPLRPIPCSICAFSKFYRFAFCFVLESFIRFCSSIRFSLYYVFLYSILKSFLGIDFGKSPKHRGLIVNTDYVPYKKQDGNCKVVESATIYHATATDPDKFPFRLHGVDLNYTSGSDLIVI